MRRLSAVLSFEQLIRFPVRQPSPEIARVHASVLGQRDGRQHDAGSMQFRCAHPMSVLDTMASVLSTASSEPRPVGTSKAGDQAGRRLEPASSVGMKDRLRALPDQHLHDGEDYRSPLNLFALHGGKTHHRTNRSFTLASVSAALFFWRFTKGLT
jgi:hypothetical protein